MQKPPSVSLLPREANQLPRSKPNPHPKSSPTISPLETLASLHALPAPSPRLTTTMRPLRRVLLPLVLLSGLAFRGVRFDDAAAALAPLLLPSPLPPLPLVLPAGGGREDESDSTEIVAVPPPLPPRELLVRPPRRQSVPTNMVTEETEPAVRN
nr:serine/threonine-protein kinase/endoribonuclease IRE1-like isoform X2 [Lolium perenne]